MAKTIFVCTGGCGGRVTEEEYRAGKTTCGAVDCPKHGQPFEKILQCEECRAEYKEGGQHEHLVEVQLRDETIGA